MPSACASRRRQRGRLRHIALLAGFSVFAESLRGRNVHIHSDNTGAQHAVANGRARQWDHTCLVHSMWLHALKLKMAVYVSRVATEVNLADEPSRERYHILRKLRAVWVEPCLDDSYAQPQAWEALTLARVL